MKFTSSAFAVIFGAVFAFTLLITIYTYYYIFKMLTAKCPKCSGKPKLTFWKVWKFSAMPWSKIVLTCKNCHKKIKVK